jgi:hypothetical protein
MNTKPYASAAILLLLTLITVRSEMSGESGRTKTFIGKLDFADKSSNQCEFSVEIERVTFKLNAVNNKYKVIRIRVENRAAEVIRLSGDDDLIEVETADGKVVRGTFDLRRQDAAVWDSWGPDMRKLLTYPSAISRAKGDDLSTRQPAVVYIFAFFPAVSVPDVPSSFRYTIKSVGEPITIRPPGVSKS